MGTGAAWAPTGDLRGSCCRSLWGQEGAHGGRGWPVSTMGQRGPWPVSAHLADRAWTPKSQSVATEQPHPTPYQGSPILRSPQWSMEGPTFSSHPNNEQYGAVMTSEVSPLSRLAFGSFVILEPLPVLLFLELVSKGVCCCLRFREVRASVLGLAGH